MTNKLSYQQKLLQRMALTPQMRHSIQILGMSITDLGEYINSIVANNPFLKKISEGKARGARTTYKESPSQRDSLYDYGNQVKDEINPRVTLLSQIRMMGLEGGQLEIAEHLISEMDDNGYITCEIEEVADRLAVDIKEVERALSAIQGMEPAGIGARDITECLTLQLKRAYGPHSLEFRIVSGHLNELAQNDPQKVAKTLKVDKKTVEHAFANIRKLNPRPASTIFSREAEKVIPELITKVEKKRRRIEVNRGAIPGVATYNPYEHDLDIIKDPEARKFLKENMAAAKALISNLKRREETICKVVDYILAVQEDALVREGRELKSLTIKDIASALKFHPSTISRVVSNKYIQVNDKVVHLKSLLSQGIKDRDGILKSKTAVKNKIRSLVAGEEKARPMSDEAIKTKLDETGINIKRRTIVKYRKELNILPSYLRKKIK